MFCLLMLLCWSRPVFSYVLPAEQILSFMMKGSGAAHSFQIFQKAVVYHPDPAAGMQEYDEVLYYLHRDRFRCEVSAPGGEQFSVASPGGALVVMDGAIVSEARPPFDYFKDVLLYLKKDEIVRRLASSGVDLGIVSFGRFKGRIAYVVGARYPDESVPQIWIEKETFRPLRYVVTGRGVMGGGVEEVEYADYTTLDDKRWYPGRILFFRNGRLAKMYVLKSGRVNPDLPDEWFDIAYLKTLYKPVAATDAAPPATSEADEVEKTIRDFSRTFE